jgi:hypothetical protein
MAVRFDAASDRLSITSSPLNYNAAYTVMFWLYSANLPSGENWALACSLDNNTYDARDDVEIYGGDSTISAFCASGGVEASTGSTAVASATWVHVAMVRASTTSLEIYVNGTASGTVITTNVASRSSITRFEFGAITSSNGDPYNGRIAQIKAWSAALSSSEIATERLFAKAQRTSNLWGEWITWPGSSARRADTSGNSRTLTAGGTLADEAAPTTPTITQNSATLTDTAALTTTAPVTDSATLADTVTTLLSGLPGVDSATLTESSSVATGGTSVSGTDSATLTDTGVIYQATSDASTLNDASGIGLSSSDSVTFAESVAIAIPGSDSAALNENTANSLGATDAATLSDAASLGGATESLTASDASAFSESATLDAVLTGSDTIAFVELAALALSATDTAECLAAMLLGLPVADDGLLAETYALSGGSAGSDSFSLWENGLADVSALVGAGDPIDARARELLQASARECNILAGADEPICAIARSGLTASTRDGAILSGADELVRARARTLLQASARASEQATAREIIAKLERDTIQASERANIS